MSTFLNLKLDLLIFVSVYFYFLIYIIASFIVLAIKSSNLIQTITNRIIIQIVTTKQECRSLQITLPKHK